MVRSVNSSVDICCLVLSVVLLYGAYCYHYCCYILPRVINSAVIWCVVLSLVLLYGAKFYQ
jgi:hypothetical protein